MTQAQAQPLSKTQISQNHPTNHHQHSHTTIDPQNPATTKPNQIATKPTLLIFKPPNPLPQTNYHHRHRHHHSTTKPQPPSRQPKAQPKNKQPTGKKKKSTHKLEQWYNRNNPQPPTPKNLYPLPPTSTTTMATPTHEPYNQHSHAENPTPPQQESLVEKPTPPH